MQSNLWTRAQEGAIESPVGNLLVSAAAGAGKTSVLIERIIHKVLDKTAPIDIDRFLIVTFTDAAATQMRQRISEALERELSRDPLNDHLHRQSFLLNRATISTIHAFCLTLLRRYFYRLGIDPAFSVMDEYEANMLKLEVLDNLLERFYPSEEPESVFYHLVDSYGGKKGDDEGLRQLVLKLHNYSRSLVNPQAWFKNSLDLLHIKEGEKIQAMPWLKPIYHRISLNLEKSRQELAEAITLASGPCGPAKYLETLRHDLQLIDNLLHTLATPSGASKGDNYPPARPSLARGEGEASLPRPDWLELGDVFKGVTHGNLKPVKGDEVDPKIKEQVQKLRNTFKNTVKKIRENYFSIPFERQLADLAKMAKNLKTLVDLVEEFDQEYNTVKLERSVVDFNDLERLSLRLLSTPTTEGDLRPSDVADELRGYFHEVLVDEYQDINPVQEAILGLVSRQESGNREQGPGEGEQKGAGKERSAEAGIENLFMVGDVKQSIYRFRLAEPKIFLKKYQSYSQGERELHRKIELRDNFRSRRPILDGVNFIFRQIMTREVGELDYGPEVALQYGANYPALPNVFPVCPNPSSAHFPLKGVDEKEEKGLPGSLAPVFGGEGQGEGGHEKSGFVPIGNAPELPETKVKPEADPESVPIEVHMLEKDLSDVSSEEEGQLQPNSPEGYPDFVSKNNSEKEQEKPDGTDQDDSLQEDPLSAEELSALEREATLVGRRIREIVRGTSDSPGPQFRIWDKEGKSYRPVSYRDIVILLRVTRGQANTYMDILSRMDIPVYAELSTGYFLTSEIRDMLSLLHIFDNPRQDIPLAAVLRSPMVGLSDEDLVRIRLCDRKNSFFDAVLKASSDDGLGEVSVKLKDFLAKMEDWRTRVRRGLLSELIWEIYGETGYYDYVGGLPGGFQRQANLRALHDRARQFGHFSRQGLFRFLKFVEKLRESEGDFGSAPALGENEDVVRITSIHKSKGLEFPVVILAGLGRKFNLKDLDQDLIYHRELGLALTTVDLEQRTKYPALPFLGIQQACRMEALAEEMRILYVAMTRARERLILVGSMKKLFRVAGEWCSSLDLTAWPLPDSLLAKSQCYLDWLGPALVRHRQAAVIRQLAATFQEPLDETIDQDPSLWKIHVYGPKELKSWTAQPEGMNVQTSSELLGGMLINSQPGGGKELDWEKIKSLQPLELNEEVTLESGQPNIGQVIEEKLNWRYPFLRLTSKFAKTSVTELKRRFDTTREEDDQGSLSDISKLNPLFFSYSIMGEERSSGPSPTIPAPLREEDKGGGESHRQPEEKITGYQAELKKRPAFLQEKPGLLTAAEKGTATHMVFQHLNLSGPLDEGEIEKQLNVMVEKELLTTAQRQSVSVAAIVRFFAGPLGQRMRQRPERVQREVPFSLGLPATEVYPDLFIDRQWENECPTPPEAPDAKDISVLQISDSSFLTGKRSEEEIYSNERVLVQGIIDCLIEEDDGFILIDYKTDDVSPESAQTRAESYGKQIELYARALQTIHHQTVKAGYIYFLALGKEIKLI